MRKRGSRGIFFTIIAVVLGASFWGSLLPSAALGGQEQHAQQKQQEQHVRQKQPYPQETGALGDISWDTLYAQYMQQKQFYPQESLNTLSWDATYAQLAQQEAEPPSAPSWREIYAQREQQAQSFSASCVRSQEGDSFPDPHIALPEYGYELWNPLHTFELHEGPILLSGAGSLDVDQESFPQELFWRVTAPNGSRVDMLWSSSITFEFQPDQPYVYIIELYAKSKTGVCSYSKAALYFTDNTPYSMTPPVVEEPVNMIEHALHLPVIGALEAREISQGEGIVIAVLDSGVNYNHPDLWANIWQNTDEIPGNQEDDDLNGYVDDTIGWDCLYNDAYPMDDYGHGSSVASLAAAREYGVAPRAQIMPLKVMAGDNDRNVRGSHTHLAECIRYAVDNGADILNISLSLKPVRRFNNHVHPLLKSALRYADKKGVLVVAAAGNSDNMNLDRHPLYPAAFTEANVIGVAATTLDGWLTEYSNFGRVTVAVAAPGGEYVHNEYYLPSANYWPQNGGLHASVYGTSSASPVTAGTLALMKSAHSEASAEELRRSLLLSGTSLWYGLPVRSGRVIHAADAIRILAQGQGQGQIP